MQLFFTLALKIKIKTLYSFQKCLLNRNRVRSSQSRGGKKGTQQVREIGPFRWCICWGVGGRGIRGLLGGVGASLGKWPSIRDLMAENKLAMQSVKG